MGVSRPIVVAAWWQIKTLKVQFPNGIFQRGTNPLAFQIDVKALAGID